MKKILFNFQGACDRGLAELLPVSFAVKLVGAKNHLEERFFAPAVARLLTTPSI